MKAMIAAILISTVTASSAIAADKAYDCPQMDKMAESVMKARQNGVPMAKMYEASVTDNSYTSRVFKMLIDGAYKESAYSSPKYKEKAIVDFRDTIFQACLQQQEQKG